MQVSNNSNNTRIVVKGGPFNSADSLPQPLQLSGNGLFLLRLPKEGLKQEWGDRPFPHYRVKLMHPLQLDFKNKFNKLYENGRIILVKLENGVLQGFSCANLFSAKKTSDFILQWKVKSPISRNEYFLLNIGNITYLSSQDFHTHFHNTFGTWDLQAIAARVSDHDLQFLTTENSSYLPIARSIQPGDILQLEFCSNFRGKVQFKLYNTAMDASPKILFDKICKINGHQFYITKTSSFTDCNFSSDKTIPVHFNDLLRNVYCVARFWLLVYCGSFNRRAQEIHQGNEENRKILNEALFQKCGIVLEGMTAKKEKQRDFSSETIRFATYFPGYQDKRRFYLPNEPGTLNFWEESQRVQFEYAGGEFAQPISKNSTPAVRFFEMDILLANITPANGQSIRDCRRETFQRKSLELSSEINNFDKLYFSYCESRIESFILSIFGPGGYLEFFSNNSRLSKLNQLYNFNIPEQAIGGFLKGFFKLSSEELEVLKNAVRKFLMTPSEKELQRPVLKNLHDVYLYLKILRQEIELKIDILESICIPPAKRLGEFKDKIALLTLRLRQIQEELYKIDFLRDQL